MAQNNRGNKNKVMAGVGLAALAAAAAGAAYFYGTESGKKKRKDIKSWSLRMWADVMDRMESVKDWSEDAFEDAVDSVAKRYKTMKNVDPVEIAAVVASLRSHWKSIRKQMENSTSKGNGTKARKAAPKRKTVK
jgi:hypothetical protein